IEKAVLTPRIGTKDGPVARAYRPDDRAFEGAAIELSGAVAGEYPTATARIEFVDADAGSDKPANARDIRLGDWAANYALSSDAIAGPTRVRKLFSTRARTRRRRSRRRGRRRMAGRTERLRA
ncbi:MAG: hypothetical protein RSD95_16505, partial [Clostridia bacterium]